MVSEQTSTRDTDMKRRRIFFSFLLLVFGFTTQMAIATFSPFPCQEIMFML